MAESHEGPQGLNKENGRCRCTQALPVQAPGVHGSVCVSPWPYGQARPEGALAAVLMVYLRVLAPAPHDTLHELQGPHAPAQSPAHCVSRSGLHTDIAELPTGHDEHD